MKSRRQTSPNSRKSSEPTSQEQRLQKVLAQAGYGSRRDCETLITEGRVLVDGVVRDELGTKVDPQSQDIRVDGERIKVARLEYYIINKPTGVISTNWDPTGRLRVVDLIPTANRVFTVGRLDKSSEGLMLVTNDGELAQRMTHPRYGIEKLYEVTVAGVAQWEQIRPLQEGVRLAEGWARAKKVRIRRTSKTSTVLEMILDEGKNREIRRILARIGHKVLKLKRVAIGTLRMGELQPGESRQLLPAEVKALKRSVLGNGPTRKKRAAKKTTPSRPTESNSRRSTTQSAGARSAAPKAKRLTGQSRSGTGTPRKKSARRPAGGADSNRPTTGRASTPTRKAKSPRKAKSAVRKNAKSARPSSGPSSRSRPGKKPRRSG